MISHIDVVNTKTNIFTKKQTKVLDLICKDTNTRDIVKELKTNQNALEAMMRAMRKKTNSRTNVGMVMYLKQNNLYPFYNFKDY